MAKPKAKAQKANAAAAKSDGAGRGRGRRIEAATSVTLGVDDKRAQYARLIVVNFGKQEGLIKKDKDVNSVSKGELDKAGKALVGGNMLDGKEGIELIQKLSKNGATDQNVAKRGLTTAYAQEVRPFLRRLMLSDNFGRRGRKASEGNGGEKAEAPVQEVEPAESAS